VLWIWRKVYFENTEEIHFPFLQRISKNNSHVSTEHQSVPVDLFCYQRWVWNILKLVWLIKMSLNEACSRVRVGKCFSDRFPIKNGLKQVNVLSPLYKAVQIWPGLFVCKQVTVCPGHIWTTLYIL
jgi:hypothetical protein